jgi:hypothetical protein
MASEGSEVKPEQQKESPAERAAKELRQSQWAGEINGIRVSGNVLLVAVRHTPQQTP